VDGYGFCGRPAYHAQKGRTQRAIARFEEAKEAAEAEQEDESRSDEPA